MPSAGTLGPDNLLYLLQGSGLDRDRKVTLSKIREYCTAQGVALYELSTDNAVSGTLTLALGAATTSVAVVVRGTARNACALNIEGSVPAGCQVLVLNAASGSLRVLSTDSTVNGIDATLALTYGDSAVLVRGTGTVWWGSATRCAANVDALVSTEASRAEQEETALSQAISAESQARESAIENEVQRAEAAEQAIATSVSNEASARTQADAALGQRIDALPSGSVKIKSASITFNGTHVALSVNTTTSILSIVLPAGSWIIDGIANFQAAANIGSDMPECKVLRAWIGDSSSTFNGDNMGVGHTPDTGTSGLSFGSVPIPRKAFTLTSETTIYLKAHCSDTPTNGTLSVFGSITATSVPSFSEVA
jgi:hypothetical protein